MAVPTISQLLELPASERAELALALWESLTDVECEEVLLLSAEEEAELDRRWSEYLLDPSSAVPWEGERRKTHSQK